MTLAKEEERDLNRSRCINKWNKLMGLQWRWVLKMRRWCPGAFQVVLLLGAYTTAPKELLTVLLFMRLKWLWVNIWIAQELVITISQCWQVKKWLNRKEEMCPIIRFSTKPSFPGFQNAKSISKGSVHHRAPNMPISWIVLSSKILNIASAPKSDSKFQAQRRP